MPEPKIITTHAERLAFWLYIESEPRAAGWQP